jgi:hypothetical protein
LGALKTNVVLVDFDAAEVDVATLEMSWKS